MKTLVYCTLSAALCLALVTLPPGRAAPVPAPSPGMDLIPADTPFLFSVRLADLWNSDCCRGLRAFVQQQGEEAEAELSGMLTGLHPRDVERLTVFSRDGGSVAIFTSPRRMDRTKFLEMLSANAVERTVAGRMCYRVEESWKTVVFLDERTAVLGTTDVLESLLTAPPSRRGPQEETLRKLGGKHTLVLGVTSEGEDGMQAFVKEFGAQIKELEPLARATHGLLTLDVEKEVRGELVLRYDSPAHTDAAGKSLDQLRKLCLEQIDSLVETTGSPAEGEEASPLKDGLRVGLPSLRKGLRGLRIERENRELRASLQMPSGEIGTLAVNLMFQSYVTGCLPWAVKSDPSLKPLAAALLAYHADKGVLPPAAHCDRDGKPLLSWRVLILPYLGDEGEALFKQFKLGEAWDGPNNIKLVRKMPKVFAGKDEDEKATTRYQVFTGKGTLFDGPEGRSLKDTKDGPANTILLTEGFRRVPWTKPEDLLFVANRPLPPLNTGFVPALGVAVAFADGETRTFRGPGKTEMKNGRLVWSATPDFDETPFKGFVTPAGGEAVDRDRSPLTQLVQPRPGIPVPDAATPAPEIRR